MSAVTGARVLLPVTARTNARRIAPWIAGVTALSVSSILAYRWIFPDVVDREHLSVALGANPALSLIFGPAHNLMTNDGFNAWRSGALGMFFAGLMAILTVVATSSADEDSGQAELLASGVMGRQARLAVAVALTCGASLVLGVVCFLITIAVGGGVVPTALLAATFTASGWMFTGVAAVAVQLGSEARSASSIAIAVLGICFVARGFIDTIDAPAWASWLTPLGWLEHVRPATDDNPWPLLPALALTVLLIAVGFILDSRRDFGAGIVPPRPGPARATGITIWSLAWRLNRGSVLTWLLAFAGLGVVFGYLATSIAGVLSDNPAMAAVLAGAGGANVTSAFVVTLLQLLGLIAAIIGVQMVNRMLVEENDFRVEPLLAAAVRRPTYLASNLLIAAATPAVCLLIAACVIGVITTVSDTGVAFGHTIMQGAVTIPAVWTLIAVAAAAAGAKPAARLAGWLAILASFGLTILGPTFKLPGWALSISPLHHIPNISAPQPHWTGLCVVVAVGIGLLGVAFAGYRHRDIL